MASDFADPPPACSRHRLLQRLLRARALAATAGLVLYPFSFVMLFLLGNTSDEYFAARVMYTASIAALTWVVTTVACLIVVPRRPGRILELLATVVVSAVAFRPLWRWWTIRTMDSLAPTMYAILPVISVMLVLVPWSWVSDQRARAQACIADRD